MIEYDLFLPIGAPAFRKVAESARKELVKYFGGLTDTRHHHEGQWKIGNAIYTDDIVIWRVLSDRGAAGERFLCALGKKLRKKLGQKELLITRRLVEVLEF